MQRIKVTPLKKIPDDRGSVCHFLRRNDPEFNRFGEIYFSTCYPGVVKGWHKHEKMELNYCVIKGMIKLVITDGNEFKEIYMGDKNYCRVKIPPGLWNGFKNIGTEEAIVANCATEPYSDDDIVRIPTINTRFMYVW